MSDPQRLEIKTRYVAGFAMMPGGEGEEPTPVYSVHAKLETGDDPDNMALVAVSTVIPEMSREQAEHLHLQLSNALGMFRTKDGNEDG